MTTIPKKYEGKLKAWEPVGDNRPTRLVELAPLTGDIVFEGHRSGGHPSHATPSAWPGSASLTASLVSHIAAGSPR